VTAVHAARNARQVSVFEASEEHVEITRNAARRNNVAGRINVYHGLVGPEMRVHGPTANAPVIEPEDLPSANVLEMDIEGAELHVLENLQFRPRVMIVESHPQLKSPDSAVRSAIERLDYQIESTEQMGGGDNSLFVARRQ